MSRTNLQHTAFDPNERAPKNSSIKSVIEMEISDLEKEVIFALSLIPKGGGKNRVGGTTRFIWCNLKIKPSEALNTLKSLNQRGYVQRLGMVGNQINWRLTIKGRERQQMD